MQQMAALHRKLNRTGVCGDFYLVSASSGHLSNYSVIVLTPVDAACLYFKTETENKKEKKVCVSVCWGGIWAAMIHQAILAIQLQKILNKNSFLRYFV